MVQKTDRKVHRYGIEVEGVQFHSDELKALIQTIGAGATVDVRYDPGDIREIAVCHAKLTKSVIVPAKSAEIAAVSFAEARRAKEAAASKAADRDARATAAELALSAQKLAEERGRGKVTSLKSARARSACVRSSATLEQVEVAGGSARSRCGVRTNLHQSCPSGDLRGEQL